MAWDGVSRAPTTLRKRKPGAHSAFRSAAEAMRRRTGRSDVLLLLLTFRARVVYTRPAERLMRDYLPSDSPTEATTSF